MKFRKLLLPLAFVTVLVSCSKTSDTSSTGAAPLDETSKKKNTPTPPPPPPSCGPTITISNCVYIGYPPSCTDITVNVPGNVEDYIFEWSDNTGNCGNTNTVNVCPTCPTTYTVIITSSITSEQWELSKTITPIDVRCGNNNDKVLVCHIPPGNPGNAHEICISHNGVQAHLNHGCKVGPCGATCE